MKITVRLAQFSVENSIEHNASIIKEILHSSQKHEWVVFPEGALSWYTPDDPKFADKIDFGAIEKQVDTIKEIVNTRKLHVIVGSVIKHSELITNSALYFDYHGNEFVYDKYNLGVNDRSNFNEGNELGVHEVDGVTFGMQICRDNAFPEPWRVLKQKGAQIIFHLNNAIRESDLIRKHILITRAFENQYFVCSANNSHKPQALPSLVINPNGEVISETRVQTQVSETVSIDLDECVDYYVDESKLKVS